MNRLPAKQIYLLSVIIVGIIALSVYSTYALFTFESETSDIVAIHTPKSLTISENIYEYQQLVLEPNTVTTTDVDIYNAFEYDVCYSVWYKIIGDKDTQDKIQIFEKTSNNLSTSGTMQPNTNIRVTIVLVNDHDSQVKVNLGTIGASKTEESCTLNLSTDKQVIVSSYPQTDILTTKLLQEANLTKETESGYLTYKDVVNTVTFKDNDKIYVSKNFTYKDEIFTLEEGKEITIQELKSEYNLEINDIYFCKNNLSCEVLYNINEIEIKDSKTLITKYDKYIGYSKGTNGLRKINDTDYVYYGDNPNNFIYYNCSNPGDTSSCELWRIVGFFYNAETKQYNTKIVRNDSIGKYQFDYKMNNDINKSTNNWMTSTLNKYLNEEYKLLTNSNIYLAEYSQQTERIPDLEVDVKNIKISSENHKSKISLLNLTDYLYTSSCQKNKVNEYSNECLTNNWLKNSDISYEWTLTSKEVVELPTITEETTNEETTTEENDLEENPEISTESESNNQETAEVDEETQESQEAETNNYVINYVYSVGKGITENDVNDSLEVRPVVFLKQRMLLLNGNGTLESPYIVK